MTTEVWYHAGCWDGFGAAWAVWDAHRNNASELHFSEIYYGAPLPCEPEQYADVWFLDFAPTMEQMRELLDDGHRVLVLDHHKTAAERFKGFSDPLAELHFDMEHSGAALAWFHFHEGSTDLPDIIRYVEDRDLWRWDLPRSKEFNANLRSYPRDFKAWDELHDTIHERNDETFLAQLAFCREGEAILREQERIVGDHLPHARPVRFGDHVIACVNATTLFSEIAGRLAKGSENGLGAAFFYRSDGKVQYSLRSCGDTDVSDIAESFGGGGHPKAAGFERSELLPVAT